jgi:hypothetical protein
LANKNCIHDKINSSINSGMAAVMQFLICVSFCLFSKDVKITDCKNIALPVALYGSVTLYEEHSLRLVCFGINKYEVMARWKKQRAEELCCLQFQANLIQMKISY